MDGEPVATGRQLSRMIADGWCNIRVEYGGHIASLDQNRRFAHRGPAQLEPVTRYQPRCRFLISFSRPMDHRARDFLYPDTVRR